MAAQSSGKKLFGILPPEALPGALLVLIAVVAMIIVNSSLGPSYKAFLGSMFTMGPAGDYSHMAITMKVSDWIKNALMAVFFLFVGLELKRELLEGQLSNAKVAALPVLAAAGGMAAPALLYLLFGQDGFARGWAIPAATDIAFALGVLSLLGSRVPAPLKAFLLAVAVVDDLGAILIVAFFYTAEVSTQYLLWAAGITAVLFVMNRLKIGSVGLFLLMGLVLWIVMHRSGVSATLAGVIVAACVPLKDRSGSSPLHAAEHDLRPWVLFGIMPVFAFANAGVNLSGAGEYLTHPVTLGAALGLLLGKPIGIGLMTLLGAAILKAPKPGNLVQIIGVGCLAGIGFTMSLFVGALAFDDPALQTPVRLGVYAGSVMSAILGLAILASTLPKQNDSNEVATEDAISPFVLPEPKYAQYDREKP
jgi:Na+:H+ antiporter, NhaA family